MASNTSRDGDDKEIEHKIERQTWVSEYEIYELSDDGENSSYHMLRNEARLRTRKRWSALAASGFARIEQRVNT